MMQEAPPSVCRGNHDFGWLQEFLLINLVRYFIPIGIRTSPVVAAVEGSRRQAYLVARIFCVEQ